MHFTYTKCLSESHLKAKAIKKRVGAIKNIIKIIKIKIIMIFQQSNQYIHKKGGRLEVGRNGNTGLGDWRLHGEFMCLRI